MWIDRYAHMMVTLFLERKCEHRWPGWVSNLSAALQRLAERTNESESISVGNWDLIGRRSYDSMRCVS